MGIAITVPSSSRSSHAEERRDPALNGRTELGEPFQRWGFHVMVISRESISESIYYIWFIEVNLCESMWIYIWTIIYVNLYIQWISWREHLHRKPARFSHEDHGIFLYFFPLKPINRYIGQIWAWLVVYLPLWRLIATWDFCSKYTEK